MKLGFQLSGTSKRQKIINSDDNIHQNIEIITSIEDSTITSLQPIITKQPLVIPLIQPVSIQDNTSNSIDSTNFNFHNIRSNDSKLINKESQTSLQQNDLDILATEELLKELNSNHNKDSSLYSNLVIPSLTNNDLQTENENISKYKVKPLLMLNVAPELLTIKDEGERFKYDVSSRANDLNVRSEIYEQIPVEEFGAALLRGMGWSGHNINDHESINNPNNSLTNNPINDKLIPREKNLGLGALPKPPSKAMKKNHTNHNHNNKELQKHWNQKVQQKINSQKFSNDNIIWFLNTSEYLGQKAIIIASSGVPGLDRIRVQLEKSGQVVDVSRKECVLISDEDLLQDPYQPSEHNQIILQKFLEQNQHTKYSGLTNTNDNTTSSNNNKVEISNITTSKNINIQDNLKKDLHNNNSEKIQTAHNLNTSKDSIVVDYWLCTGVRVKVISKSFGKDAYLRKGTVVDVYSRGKASVRLDATSSHSKRMIDGISERHVETVIPKAGGMVMILKGSYKGEHATVLNTATNNNTVTIQLLEDLEVVEIDMDSISEIHM